MIRQDIAWSKVKEDFNKGFPFRYTYIDNFFEDEFARRLAESIPDVNDETFGDYFDFFEKKKVISDWSKLPSEAYNAFMLLSKDDFVFNMRYLIDSQHLWLDVGLHQAGLEIYEPGDDLSVHLGYEMHPFTKLQRKINLIVFLEKEWNNDWGGGFELWEHDSKTGKPTQPVKAIANVFNRAIIFDASQKSWHGLPMELKTPDGVYRKTLNVNYLHQVPIKREVPTQVNINDRLFVSAFDPVEEEKL